MNATEIAAYIGAAAWAPQIINWVYRKFSKPALELIPSPTLEMGYNLLDPIIDLTCSISSQKKDALISKMYIEVKHEKGEIRELTWKFLNEIQQQIRSDTGATAEISKNQPAVALKVPTISLVEKIIGFQDLEWSRKFRDHFDKLREFQNFEKKGKDDVSDEVIHSKEFNDLLEFFKSAMYWKEGQYLLLVHLKEVSLRKVVTREFKFEVSKIDAEKLNQNTSYLEKGIKLYLNPPKADEEKVEIAPFNWIYPEIT
jgi:hypothetical protein